MICLMIQIIIYICLKVRLSFITCSKLDPELLAIKRSFGLTLLKFEDANIDLPPFCRQHSFENSQILLNSIIKHYKDVSIVNSLYFKDLSCILFLFDLFFKIF